MGKVHRIKKDFQRLVSQPISTGNHKLAGGLATIYVGKRLRDGGFFLMYNSWHHDYQPLIIKLIREYEAGVAHSDKSPVKG